MIEGVIFLFNLINYCRGYGVYMVLYGSTLQYIFLFINNLKTTIFITMIPTDKQLKFLMQVDNNTYSYGFIIKNGRVLPDKSYVRACIWNKWVNYENSKCTLTTLGRQILNLKQYNNESSNQ